MKYERMLIEVESPEEYGYEKIRNNLSESSCTDRTLQSLELELPDITLLYNQHKGNSSLRKLIVDGIGLNQEDVLITAGAAGALFIISTSQLSKDDHLIVVRPNYATNIETPRAIGCEISFVDLEFDTKFQPDLSAVESAFRDNTKLVSITCPHNPTGTLIDEKSLDELVKITRERGCLLLVDETYRDVGYGRELPIAATLGNHVISVCSLSKSYGVPGLRLGWIITTNTKLQETFLAAKEQISISGSVIDEWIAEQVLSRKNDLIAEVRKEMTVRRHLVEKWVEKEDLIEWVKPEGGVVCFPRMVSEPPGGTAAFYQRLLHKYGTYVGPGHWFEMPDTYFRVGYGWPTQAQLEDGLASISKCLRDGTGDAGHTN